MGSGNKEVERITERFAYEVEICLDEWIVFKEKLSTHYLIDAMSARNGNTYDFWMVALNPLNDQLWKSRSGLNFVCLRKLFLQILVIPASSADAERGFSFQNLIKTDVRNSLKLPALEAVMRVKLNGDIENLSFVELARQWIRKFFLTLPLDRRCTQTIT